jgi:hypothetical protein
MVQPNQLLFRAFTNKIFPSCEIVSLQPDISSLQLCGDQESRGVFIPTDAVTAQIPPLLSHIGQ